MTSMQSDPVQTAYTDSSHEAWLPLVEYSVKNGVSLSTLRRHIKADKIRYKVQEGRYLIFDGPDEAKVALSNKLIEGEASTSQVASLRAELGRAQEEIAELKMLIALYEEKLPSQRLDV